MIHVSLAQFAPFLLLNKTHKKDHYIHERVVVYVSSIFLQ